jgi:hypothetical protein
MRRWVICAHPATCPCRPAPASGSPAAVVATLDPPIGALWRRQRGCLGIPGVNGEIVI